MYSDKKDAPSLLEARASIHFRQDAQVAPSTTEATSWLILFNKQNLVPIWILKICSIKFMT